MDVCKNIWMPAKIFVCVAGGDGGEQLQHPLHQAARALAPPLQVRGGAQPTRPSPGRQYLTSRGKYSIFLKMNYFPLACLINILDYFHTMYNRMYFLF